MRRLALLVVTAVTFTTMPVSSSDYQVFARLPTQQYKALAPRVAISTYNNLKQGVLLQGSLWWAKWLLISRLYNPHIPFVAIVNRKSELDASTVAEHFKAAGIQMVEEQAYLRNGSRAAELESLAPQLLSRVQQALCPDKTKHPCGKPVMVHHITMFTRFCMQADLANELDVDYMLVMDADVVLLDNVMSVMLELMQETQVLVHVEFSSQYIIFSRKALNAFCDSMLEHIKMPEEEANDIFHAGGLYLHKVMGFKWCDMHFLAAFLRAMHPELSRTILCGSPTTHDRAVCPRLKYNLMLNPSMLAYSLHNQNCSSLFDHFVDWKMPCNPGDLPQLWTKFKYVPSQKGPPERVPSLHVQGRCKQYSPDFFSKPFVESGLIPDF